MNPEVPAPTPEPDHPKEVGNAVGAEVGDDVENKVRTVEILISNLLRGGVVLSMLTVLLGTVLSFIHHPDYTTSKEELALLTQPGATFPHSIMEVFTDARAGHGQAIVIVGLVFLIATPVLRVAISIFAFMYQHDRAYVVITTVVLILLLASFALGKVEG
ncbi:MAG: DUF1634 domain-containing protein [Planctomycetes bacterium]|nr:DUF1634 domain-containing protein [Planctomycetota bacterium]